MASSISRPLLVAVASGWDGRTVGVSHLARRRGGVAGLAAALVVSALMVGAYPLAASATARGASRGDSDGAVEAATVTRSAGGVTASMHAGTHHPRVNHPWYLKFSATRGGHAVKASVSYEYLFNGLVVAKRSHYEFKGSFSDTFRFPASAVGYPLTFRAVIVSGAAKINLDYAVQGRR